MLKKRSSIILLTLLFVILLSMSVSAVSDKQSPVLQEAVERGDLEPLADRIPVEPLVTEPWHEIGKYGGTWNRATTSEDLAFMRLAMYGFSILRYDDNLDVVPGLAKDWEANEDKTEWTLYFREGTKWSDGNPFTVDDVLFWYEDMAKNGEHSEAVPNFMIVDGQAAEMEKIDDYTLKVIYQKPNPIFDFHLAMWSNGGLGAYIVAPKHYLKQYHPDYSDEYTTTEVFEEKQQWWINTDCPVLTEFKVVEHVPGEDARLKRNPYYYEVDTEGNQLPYIDEVRVSYYADLEVVKLQYIEGNVDMQVRPYISLRESSMLLANEEQGNYTTYMWESGSGSGPLIYPNWNHPDPAKREIYRTTNFRRALSHSLNRERIQRLIYYDMGQPTIGTFSPKTPEYLTEEGKEIMEEWRTSYIEYDPELAKKLLDEIDVVDQNNDGWRQLPNGDELTLRIDMAAGAGDDYIDASQLKKDMWEEIGLRTIINTVDGAQLSQMQVNATIDIRDSWEWAGDHVYPHWLYPIGNGRWAPLYGAWKMIEGTVHEGTELDKDPRDRTPPREEPAEGGPVARLQALYDQVISESDLEKRNQLIYEATRIHIDDGPFVIGTVGEFPQPFIVKNYFKNVPTREDLSNRGLVFPWHIPHPAVTNISQYYIDK